MRSTTFQVVGGRFVEGEQDALRRWASETTRWSIADSRFEQRVLLVHSPEETLSHAIENVYPVGTPLGQISLDAEQDYCWRERTWSGAELHQALCDLRRAVRVYVYVDGERCHVGWVPADVAEDILDELEHIYVYSAEVHRRGQHDRLYIRVEARWRRGAGVG